MSELAQSSSRVAVLLARLEHLRSLIEDDSQKLADSWLHTIPESTYRDCARNLAAYLAIRNHDLSQIQEQLVTLGLSTLGRCEGHVMASLDAVSEAARRICGQAPGSFPSPELFTEPSRKLLERSRNLFGQTGQGRAIMVTMPSDAAGDGNWVEELVAAGMDCARINCAHDGPDEWSAIASHVRKASKKLGRACSVLMDMPGPKCRIEMLYPEKPPRLTLGAMLRLTRSPGRVKEDIPSFSVTFSDAIDKLAVGNRVSIDDGKIRCSVIRVEGEDRILNVIGAREKGEKLRVEKGVNFPGVQLGLPALSDEDRAALPLILRHADILGFSFVQRVRDLDDLDAAIRAIDPARVAFPLILKIETPEAIANLPKLLVRAAGSRPTGVMIARGDLAVELGNLRLAEMQEEMLWLCEAARVPVVWATQVLEDLVKDGLPSRAETTDAAMAQRAECVMLNKGAHVKEAISFLKEISTRMARHQDKKSARLGALKSWPISSQAMRE
jgi:pyruvate kinase